MRIRSLPLLLAAATGGTAHAATIVVDTASDDPAAPGCSLREAIWAASPDMTLVALPNDCPAGDPRPAVDTIAFAIPGEGPHVIAPTSLLPVINEPVKIDGYTQAGSSQNTQPIVAVEGSHLSNAVLQVVLDGTNAGDSLRRVGLDFETGSEGSVVTGLRINHFVFWVRFLGEYEAAIRIAAPDVSVKGNAFGIGPFDGEAQPNGTSIVISAAGDRAHVGGPAAADANVIGAADHGLLWVEADDVRIEGNLIGSGAAGVVPFFATIGPNLPATAITLWEARRASVSDNFIRSTLRGVESYGNGAADHRIFRNRLSDSGEAGVVVHDGRGVAISENRYESSGLAIDLAGDGPTPNDAFDLDDGPNGYINHPTVTSAHWSNGGITLGSVLQNAPLAMPLPIYPTPEPTPLYAVELYGSDSCHASNRGPVLGSRYIGRFETPLHDDARVTEWGGVGVMPKFVSATVTGPEGTSEFSPCFTVVDDGVFASAFE